MPTPVSAKSKENFSRSAKKGFWLAICGAILWWVPFLPILPNILGLQWSLQGRRSSRRRLANAGVVIALFGLLWNFFFGWGYLAYLNDLEKEQVTQQEQ